MDLDLSTLSAPAGTRHGAPFRILVVCTGNVCRSAYAAALLETLLSADLPPGTVEVESAGTDVAPTVLMPAAIRDGILALGIDPAAHRITPLDLDAIESADLVLTMTARQRAAVAQLAPFGSAKVQLLTQFARLSQLGPDLDRPTSAADGMRSVVTDAIAARGLHAGVDLDIADPWGRDDAFFARCISQISAVAEVIATRLVAAARSSR